MRITTKGEYGIRALYDLAQHEGEGLVQSAAIASRQNIPEAYLSQLLLVLRKAGLVHSIRGPQGGHRLSRPASSINMGEAMTALEGPMLPMDCLDPNFTDCCFMDTCTLRPVWQDLKSAADDVLYSTTIADLLHRRQQPAEPMYFI